MSRFEKFLFDGAAWLRLENWISSPFLLICFEGVNFHRVEKHLAGFFTVRKKSITGKILLMDKGSVNSNIRVSISTFERTVFYNLTY